MNKHLAVCLSMLAAPHGRPRTPQSWCETVTMTGRDGRVIEKTREFFFDDAAGRAALIILAVKIGPEKVKEARARIASLDQLSRPNLRVRLFW